MAVKMNLKRFFIPNEEVESLVNLCFQPDRKRTAEDLKLRDKALAGTDGEDLYPLFGYEIWTGGKSVLGVSKQLVEISNSRGFELSSEGFVEIPSGDVESYLAQF